MAKRLARIVSAGGGTVATIGGVAAVLAGRAIFVKLTGQEAARRAIPWELLVVFGAGLAVTALALTLRLVLRREIVVVRGGAPGRWGSRRGGIAGFARSTGMLVLLVLVTRATLVEAFHIPSGSMIPTLQVGDRLFVDKVTYRLRAPEAGEVVVVRHPRDEGVHLIKRIAAVGGDTVELREGAVWVNGRPTERVEAGRCTYEDFDAGEGRWTRGECDARRDAIGGRAFTTIVERGAREGSWPPVVVPQGHLFLLGDHRDRSHDSRYFGPVAAGAVVGKARLIFWSSGEPEGIRFRRLLRRVE